jgi:hypothetical protein
MRALAVALALLAPPVTHDVLPVYVPPAGNTASLVEFASSDGGPSAAPLRLGVFRRPRTPADEAPQRLQMFAQFVGGRLGRSRVLIATGGMQIYAFPADGGKVCFMLLPLGGGRCLASLIDGAYPQVDPRRDVWGIVDDDATRVDVLLGSRILHPALGRNAFFATLPMHTVVPKRIVVHEHDGSRHVYDVKRCAAVEFSPFSSLLGPPC